MRSSAAPCFMSEKGKLLGDFNIYIIFISVNTSVPLPRPFMVGMLYIAGMWRCFIWVRFCWCPFWLWTVCGGSYLWCPSCLHLPSSEVTAMGYLLSLSSSFSATVSSKLKLQQILLSHKLVGRQCDSSVKQRCVCLDRFLEKGDCQGRGKVVYNYMVISLQASWEAWIFLLLSCAKCI